MNASEQQAAKLRRRRGYLLLAAALVAALYMVAADHLVSLALMVVVVAIGQIVWGIARSSQSLLVAGVMFLLLCLDVLVMLLTRDRPDWERWRNACEGGMILLCLATPVLLGLAARRAMPRTALAWKCRGCGHDLYGLTLPRCPECGCAVDADQVVKAPPGVFLFDVQEASDTAKGNK